MGWDSNPRGALAPGYSVHFSVPGGNETKIPFSSAPPCRSTDQHPDQRREYDAFHSVFPISCREKFVGELQKQSTSPVDADFQGGR